MPKDEKNWAKNAKEKREESSCIVCSGSCKIPPKVGHAALEGRAGGREEV